jgi:hypothetical protein
MPTPGGECCTDHGGPGCDDSTCQACVCDVDDACCNNVWDADCVSEARVECALACPCATEGDCCAAHDGIGCEDAECKNCVCGLDAACCTDGQGWDADCVDEATVECAASCTCEVAGSCCEDHIDTVGCDDRPCQACVCDADPPCCTDGWDPQCADEAATNCSERCTASNCKASCCETHDQPGCVDATCQTCVCNEDDFCCSDNGGVWDQGCPKRNGHLARLPVHRWLVCRRLRRQRQRQINEAIVSTSPGSAELDNARPAMPAA